jgi:hypothetical protein
VFLIYLRIVSVNIKPYLPIKNENENEKILSNENDSDSISVSVILNEEPLFKNAFKSVKMKNNELVNMKKNCTTDDDVAYVLEELFLIEVVGVVKGLAHTSILKLPHVMDILALLGDNNLLLSTALLSKLHELLTVKTIVDSNNSTGNNIMNELKDVNGKERKEGMYECNIIFGTQLQRVVEEVEIASKQVHKSLSSILSSLSNDKIDDDNNNDMKNKNKFKSVDLSESKNLKERNNDEKLKIEKRILDIQSNAKNSNNMKSQKNVELGNISDKIIDQYVDLVLYLVDIVYSFSVFLQSSVLSVTKNGNGMEGISNNILSLSSIFCNNDDNSYGHYLSPNTGVTLISTLQYIYEEVRRRIYLLLFVIVPSFCYLFINLESLFNHS